MAWQIKAKPQDFVVREVIHDAVEESWKEKLERIRGFHDIAKARSEDESALKYLWMTMRKEDADFFTAIQAVAKALSISTKDIGYAGTKDRRAVTYQTVSVPAGNEAEARALSIPGLSFSDFRLRGRPVRLGEHEGNDFEITVRNVAKSERAKAEKKLRQVQERGFVNCFGEQRFGSVSGRNAQVGKMLVLGDVKGAVMLLTQGSPADRSPEHAMKARLSVRPDDYEGALRLAPLRMLKLLVHAYQADIWNRTVEALLRMHAAGTSSLASAAAETRKSACGKYAKAHESMPLQNVQIPVVGYMTDLRTHPKVRRHVEAVLEKEKIGPGDFRNGAFRELSSRGSERDLLCVPRDLSWRFAADGENEGKLQLSFFLQKGAYATELVRQLEGRRGPFTGPSPSRPCKPAAAGISALS